MLALIQEDIIILVILQDGMVDITIQGWNGGGWGHHGGWGYWGGHGYHGGGGGWHGGGGGWGHHGGHGGR